MNYSDPRSAYPFGDGTPVRPDPVFDRPRDDMGRVTELFQMLNARRWIVFGVFAFVMFWAVLIVYNLTPRYTATSVVMFMPQENRVVDVEAVLGQMGTDQLTIANQVQVIQSRSLAGRVIDDLGLARDPVFMPPEEEGGWLDRLDPRSWFAAQAAPDEEPDRDALIDRLLAGLQAGIAGRSTVIRIQYTSTDPALSARIANAIADTYVNDQLEAKYEATRSATEWLSERLQELSDQVQHAERMVEQYKLENNLTDTQEGRSLVNQQLADLNAQLSLARAAEAEARAKLGQANQLYSRGQSIDSITQVISSPLISQLRQQEAQLLRREAELDNRYGARHPRMVQIRAERQNLAQKIDQEVQRIIQQMRNEVAVAEARVRTISVQVEEIEEEAAVQNKARIDLRELERTATSSRQLYEAYLNRFKETKDQEGIQTSDARVISTARVPAGPSYPRKGMILGGMVPAALALGLMLAFLVERLDNGFRRADQVEQALGLPVLATVNELERSVIQTGVNVTEYPVDKPLSSFSEAIRGFQTSLALSDVDHPPKVVLVTSSVPAEGKTTFAISYARMAAQKGQKVIVLDGDFRHPNVMKAMAMEGPERGAVEYLSQQAELEDVIVRDKLTPMDVLPVVARAVNPPDLLASQRMADLLTKLREIYDLVIIDSAPILPVHDTKHIAQLADKVVFVVRWEQTPRNAAIMAIKDMRALNFPVAGAVLTRSNLRRHALYSYGYYNYAQYKKYYTD